MEMDHAARVISTMPTTPATATTPPAKERQLGFSSFNAIDMGMTTSGVVAIMGSTTPVALFSRAH